MRRSIDELIAADDEVGSGLGLPIVATPSLLRAIHPLAPGDRIGVYEILEEIGHGGMGVVYLARRADQEFEKRVAIKVARLGMAGDPLLRRFRSERQIIASLDHPNIARLLDGAKLIAPELLGATAEETVTLLRLFTPDYASPEQVRGDPVTPASDVYASGVVLYELLTGRRPYRVGTSSATEMIRVVCDAEPARPSSVAPHELGRPAQRSIRNNR